MTAPAAALEPDRNQIEIFVDSLFRYAGSEGYVSVRAFLANNEVFRISTAALTGGLRHVIDVAEDDARRAANDPKIVTFCPPLAIFHGAEGWRAREKDLAMGLALSVECHKSPDEALNALEEILGPATMVIKSGGQWIDSDDMPRDKLHLHWRLNRPAVGGELDRLKQARRLAAAIVGADTSNVPTVHCLRWPGSWWRKDQPRLCEIARASPDVEIDLDDALVKLEAVAPKPAKANGRDTEGTAAADWRELTANILAGTDLHHSIATLAAKYARSGTPIGAGVNQTRALMHASAARQDRPADWQDRLDDIPRAFDSAYAKFAETPPTSNRPQLEIFDVGNEDGNIPPRQWLLGTTYCRGYLSGLISAGAGGKTTVRILQLLSAAANQSLSGEFVFAPCRAMIVCLEDDMDELRRRVRAAMLHHHVEPTEVKGRLILTTPRKLKIAEIKDKAGTVAAGDLYHALSTAIDKLELDIICIDPAIKAHSLNENDNPQIDAFASILTGLATQKNVAVDLLSHERKAGSVTGGDVNRGRGASALKDASRLTKTITGMSETEAAALGVDEADRAFLVRLDNAKVNIAPPSRAATWFRLVGVNLGNGTEAYPNGDNVQVAEPWTPKPLFGGLSTLDLNCVLRKLGAGMEDGQRYSLANAAKDRAAWQAVKEQFPDLTETQCRAIVAAWAKNKLFEVGEYDDSVRRERGVGILSAKLIGPTEREE